MSSVIVSSRTRTVEGSGMNILDPETYEIVPIKGLVEIVENTHQRSDGTLFTSRCIPVKEADRVAGRRS